MAVATIDKFVSLNNFPLVTRNFILTNYYTDFTEDIKFKKYSYKSFYILKGHDELHTNVLFLPQNHQCFQHFNVFSETYFKVGHLDEKSNDIENFLCDEFYNEAKMVLNREILQRISETSTPELTSRLTRSLISYGRTTGCIDKLGRIALTRFCLTTLNLKAPNDYEAVVQVLTNFCCTYRLYVYELYSQYTDSFIRYIFESCVKARFNFRNFILQHPANSNSTPGDNPICPILESIILGDETFLKLYLEYGFERFPLKYTANMRYEFLRIAQYLAKRKVCIPEIRSDASNEHMQRYKLILETTYFINASINKYKSKPWDSIARLIWKSIPDPYLTVSDVTDFVAAGSDEQQVARMTAKCRSEMFKSIFEDVPQPRDLKHLCRCAVRRAIGRNFLLPLGIYELGLPKLMVEYLDILTLKDDNEVKQNLPVDGKNL